MKYRTNGHEIDVGLRVVRHGADELHVEPQVFDLILYLIENRNRVVAKDELLARVWKGRFVSDATIASRLNAARRVLGDDGRRQDVIKTLAKQGFRFMAPVSADGDKVGRPSIGVMPFALIESEDRDAHLARGLADQLSAALGQAAWFDVCDTAASFAPGLADLAPADIANALQVGYLVMGALQTTDDVLKLSVRLVNPFDGRQVWSGSLEGARTDVFQMQDKIAAELLGEIEPRLRSIELQRSEARHGNFTAFDHYLRAADLLRPMNLQAMRAACVELDKAVVEFPDYGAAHGMRAWIATLLLPQGQRVDGKAELERSRKAVSKGAFDCDALAMGGYALGYFDRHPFTGLDYVRRALAINPSSARAHDHAGWLLLYAGKPNEAMEHFERGIVLCPLDEFGFRMLTGRAFAHLFLNNFSAAVSDARRAHAVAPDYSVCHRVLISALAHDGQTAAARTAVRELQNVNAGLTVARYARETRFEGTQNRETLFAGLRLAGMP